MFYLVYLVIFKSITQKERKKLHANSTHSYMYIRMIDNDAKSQPESWKPWRLFIVLTKWRSSSRQKQNEDEKKILHHRHLFLGKNSRRRYVSLRYMYRFMVMASRLTNSKLIACSSSHIGCGWIFQFSNFIQISKGYGIGKYLYCQLDNTLCSMKWSRARVIEVFFSAQT